MRQWNPFEEMDSLFRDMDRLFRRTYSEGALQPERGLTLTSNLSMVPSRSAEMTSQFTPAVEAFRKDNQIVLRAEIPGVNPEDVEITVVNNRLHLRGERKHSNEVRRDDYFFSESSYGFFERYFTLPQGVKPEDVKASFKNGVLEITLPAKEHTQTFRVKLEGAPEGAKLESSKQGKPAA